VVKRLTNPLMALVFLTPVVFLLACSPQTAPQSETEPVVKAVAIDPEPESVQVEYDLDDYPNRPHHLDGELSCLDCHGTTNPTDIAPMEYCLECHGPLTDLVDMTEQGEHRPNVHNSPHYGPDNSCDLCHYEHEEPENMCAECHEWAIPMP